MKGFACGAYGGWCHTLWHWGKAFSGGWRDCPLGLTEGLALISELAGLHQEEGTDWLPPGGGDLAEEQCSCAGEQGIAAYVLLLFAGIWCVSDAPSEPLSSLEENSLPSYGMVVRAGF